MNYNNVDNKEESLELSVVIPVYNEEKNIAQTLLALKQNIVIPHEIIIVYDFDEDTTLPVVRSIKDDFKNLTIVKNCVARGPSGALRTGFARAKAPRVLSLMADMCDDFTQIGKLLNLVPVHADIACPSRYCKGGEQQLNSNIYLKALIPRVAGLLLMLFAGIPTYDPTNSFKLYSAEVLKRLTLRSTISFSVTLEIVVKAYLLGFRIVEVPTVWYDRQHGKSNFKLGRSIFAYMPWFLLAFLCGRIIRLLQKWIHKLFGLLDNPCEIEKIEKT